MLTYLLLIAVSILAIFALIKDWDAYKKNWRRGIVLLLIILTGIGGIINNCYRETDSRKQHESDQTKITDLKTEVVGLKSAVETANQNQKDNTSQFLDSFGKLSQKLSDLQTQIKTARLQKEAVQLREQLAAATKATFSAEASVTRLKSDLDATQKALNPPKAKLTFTFAKSNPEAPPIRDVTLPVKDNTIHVEFSVRNETDTPALDGELTIFACDECKFASEPPEFRRLPGQIDTQRVYKFTRIFPKTELKTLSADIQVPQNVNTVEFGVNYRCTNCDIPEKAMVGIVRLAR